MHSVWSVVFEECLSLYCEVLTGGLGFGVLRCKLEKELQHFKCAYEIIACHWGIQHHIPWVFMFFAQWVILWVSLMWAHKHQAQRAVAVTNTKPTQTTSSKRVRKGPHYGTESWWKETMKYLFLFLVIPAFVFTIKIQMYVILWNTILFYEILLIKNWFWLLVVSFIPPTSSIAISDFYLFHCMLWMLHIETEIIFTCCPVYSAVAVGFDERLKGEQ